MVQKYGDRQAVEALVLDHLPDIVTLCHRMFSQVSDAQDATHEAVLEILRALPTYRGAGPVRRWILKVALNAARQHRRALALKKRREQVMTDPEHPAPAPPGDTREDQEALRVAIAGLPDELREPVTLYYYHSLTQAEIGQLLNCSQKTVHQRLEKGKQHLGRKLAGNSALGALLVTAPLGTPTLDPVAPELVAAVQDSISSYFSGAAATATGGSAPLTTTSTATTSGLVTGGIIMHTKLWVAAGALAVAGLIGGVLLRDNVFPPEAPTAEHAAEVARLAGEIDTLESDLSSARDTHAARIAELTARIEQRDAQIREKDEAIVGLDARLENLLAQGGDGTGGGERTRSREERWEDIQGILSKVTSILEEMQREGANQMALGPQLVAALGGITTDEYQQILDFDADETDPEITSYIRAVMIQAFTFVRDTGPLKNDYMARYLDRVEGGGYGEQFNNRALGNVTAATPPYFDRYKSIVEPLDDELQARFLDVALERATNGDSDRLRLDGVHFLARSSDPRAGDQLMRTFEHSSNSQQLRLAALNGLAWRDDERVLQFLRGRLASEHDTQVEAALEKAVSQVAGRVAAER